MQQLNPSEISALIKQRIGDLDTSATAKNEGTIYGIRRYRAHSRSC